MEKADEAFAHQRKGDASAAQACFVEAFTLEKNAAETALSADTFSVLDKAVLLRSAATLALDIRNYPEAVWLANTALNLNPPAEIKLEIEELLQEIAAQSKRSPKQNQQQVFKGRLVAADQDEKCFRVRIGPKKTIKIYASTLDSIVRTYWDKEVSVTVTVTTRGRADYELLDGSAENIRALA